MDGQQLYNMYCLGLRATGRGYNVVSVTQSQGCPGAAPVPYQLLSPTAKAFWQRLAQDFIDAQPIQRGMLNMRNGRIT